MYKCTEAGINSHITVPREVCASQVFTKLLQRVKFSSDQIKLSEKVSLERDRALCSFSHGPHGGEGYIYEHSTVMKVLLYKYLKRPNPSMPTPKENI